MSVAQSIPVALAGRSYAVQCGRGLLQQTGEICAPFARTGRAIVVTDSAVGPLYGPAVMASLEGAGLQAVALQVAAGEASKSWEGLAGLCEGLAAERAERGDLIVALGGGVIGDLAGFAAGVFKRGMDFVQIPTTLLAQVDSSVGGKTAIDIPSGKNLVGLFHQPRAVIVDYSTLDSLPAREMRAGFAEVIKYGLLGDRAFFDWLTEHGSAVLTRAPDALAYAVETSIRAKAAIVAADERETADLRALLNLGHTFGHGFEAIAGFDGRLLHGEAVACGMALAFHYAARTGFCPSAEAEKAISSLAAFGFETDPRALPGGPFAPEAMIAAMAQDKKASGGKLTLILPEAIGQAKVVDGIDLNPVQSYLGAVLGEGLK